MRWLLRSDLVDSAGHVGEIGRGIGGFSASGRPWTEVGFQGRVEGGDARGVAMQVVDAV